MFEVETSEQIPEREVPGTRDREADHDEPTAATFSEQELDQLAAGDAGTTPYPPYL
ncbi:MAG TPA: hypothetical protein VI248_17585 [Kineosporiaceae bacterium]